MLKRLRPRRPSAGTTVGGVVLMVATAGVATAAIPTGGGNISACVDGRTGVVRAVDEGSPCRTTETGLKLASADANGRVRDSKYFNGHEPADFLRSTAPARGDLEGNFPAPTVGAGRIDSAKVADDSLTGADIDEATLELATGLTTRGSGMAYAEHTLQLTIPRSGAYFVLGNVTATNRSATGPGNASCFLYGGDDVDEASARLPAEEPTTDDVGWYSDTVSMQLLGTFAAGDRVRVHCTSTGPNRAAMGFHGSKLSAIRLATATRVAPE